jgi:hypothetical protein
MRAAYAVVEPRHAERVRAAAEALMPRVERYAAWLQQFDARAEPPSRFVFTDARAATEVLSNYWLPAWTNTETRLVYIDPIVEDWRRIFADAIPPTLSKQTRDATTRYYESLDEDDVAAIIGHELTHHLTAFAGDGRTADWFEEGFCHYLPRSRMLTPERRSLVSRVEERLVRELAEPLGKRPLEPFGYGGGGDVTAVLFDYWRATATVSRWVSARDGSAREVLAGYSAWRTADGEGSLAEQVPYLGRDG